MNWKRILGCILALGLVRIISAPAKAARTCKATVKCDITLSQLCRKVLNGVSQMDTSTILIIITALAVCMCFAMGTCGFILRCTKQLSDYIMGPCEPMLPSDREHRRRPSRSLATPSSDQSEERDVLPAAPTPKRRQEPKEKGGRFGKKSSSKLADTEVGGSSSTDDTERSRRSSSRKSSTTVSTRGSKSSHSIDSRTSVTRKTKSELEFAARRRKSTTTVNEPTTLGAPSSSNASLVQSDNADQGSRYNLRPVSSRRSVTLTSSTSAIDTIIMPPPPPVTSVYSLRNRRSQSPAPRRRRVISSSSGVQRSSSREELPNPKSARKAKEKGD